MSGVAGFALTTTQPVRTQLQLADGSSVEAFPVPLVPFQGVAASSFVFQPGGVAGPNVFTDWPSLMAAVGGQPGPRAILIDGTFAATNVPAGNWNLDQCTLYAKPAGQALTFQNGATIAPFNFLAIRGLLTLASVSATPVATLSGATASVFIVAEGSGVQASAAAPFFRISNSLTVMQFQANGILNGPNPVVSVDVGQTLFCVLGSFSSFAANVLSGAGTVQADIPSDCSVGTPQSVATLTRVNVSSAALVSYVPGVGANWQPAPTQTAAALDQLAAPNFVQQNAAVGAAAATQTITTGNIAKKKTGNVRVSAQQTVTTSGAAIVTFQLSRDAGNIGPAVQFQVAAAQVLGGSIDFVDTLPDNNNHTYTITATASAGTITQAVTSGSVSAQEL